LATVVESKWIVDSPELSSDSVLGECLNFKVERLALRGAVGSQRDPSHQIKTLLNRLPFGIGDDYIME